MLGARCCRWRSTMNPGRSLPIVMLSGAGISLAVTVAGGSPPRTVGDVAFITAILLAAVLPYLAVWGLGRARASAAAILLFGGTSYLLIDLAIRTQALFLPSSSTDSLAVVFLPMLSPFIIGAGALLGLAVCRASRHTQGSR